MGKYTDDRFKQYIKEFNRVLKEMEKEALKRPYFYKVINN